MHECRGLQRVVRTLAAQIALGQSAQFRVDDGYQLVQHFRMAVAPVQKHLG
jgi:hypothetical protein